jgi:hypothetical protein
MRLPLQKGLQSPGKKDSEMERMKTGELTAPIPELAPVMRTVLPSRREALKMDIEEEG